jgi:hypothetical protein
MIMTPDGLHKTPYTNETRMESQIETKSGGASHDKREKGLVFLQRIAII